MAPTRFPPYAPDWLKNCHDIISIHGDRVETIGSGAKKSRPARDVALILSYCVGKVGPIIDTFLMSPQALQGTSPLTFTSLPVRYTQTGPPKGGEETEKVPSRHGAAERLP